MKDFRYDVVVAYRPGIAAEIALRHIRAGRKIMFYHHGAFLRNKNDSLHYRLTDHIICVSRSNVKKELIAAFPEFEHKIVFMGNVVSVPEHIYQFTPPGKISDSRILIVSVGRLVHDKGFDLLIQACANLRKQGFDIYLTLVGGADSSCYDRALTELIEKLNMNDFVTITGFQQEPYKFVAAADIYVQPSRFEAFGLTIREAQMCGKPVISTHTDGACELIDDNKTGMICDCSADAITLAIRELIGNPELREHLIRSCKNMDFNEYNKKQLNVFDAICNQ